MAELPCNVDGVCMRCSNKPSDEELLTCRSCETPWHVVCLASPLPTLSSTIEWMCPDCLPTSDPPSMVGSAKHLISENGEGEKSGKLIAAIRAIVADPSLTEREKAKRQQELVSGQAGAKKDEEVNHEKVSKGDSPNDVMNLFGGNFNCAVCMHTLERPVTTPCGHNFCLKCFNKWVGQGKNTCAKCRNTIPHKMTSQPRINSTLVVAIRMARMSKSVVNGGATQIYHVLHNQNRPDSAFTTERAKKTGKANASSGKIFVTIPRDYFGPITAENDPIRNQGLNVGECWADRLECRQWGAHFPHVSGISGQSKHGAQSVALSGGYEDDEDHGEWFLYTGSGGRDLSGNKRTNKDQSFDQKFEKGNEALRVSCLKGYPVRVVRSHKEKRSAYAPTEGVRYDGIYRIEKCWRKVGKQGYKVCRYLFVRCDNDPAPWTSDVHGDRPRPFPSVPELKDGIDITVRKENPSWDYDDEVGWKWMKPPPQSVLPVESHDPDEKIRVRSVIKKNQNTSVMQKLLKEFSCLLCHKVMTLPLTTPCAHNFCKPCLESTFAGQAFVQERTTQGGRSLRAKKTVMKCPSCPLDISDFLQNPQVNRELMEVIETLQRKSEENGDGIGEFESKEEKCDGVASKIESDDLKEGEEDEGERKVEANDVRKRKARRV